MVYINSIGRFLPGPAISNFEIDEVLGTCDALEEKIKHIILKRNGITSRHYVMEKKTRKSLYTNAEITKYAILDAVERCQFQLQELELLCAGTTVSDQLLPSHASMVHGILNAPSCEVISTAGICCSAMAALKYGYLSIKSGEKTNAICTGSEVSSKFMQKELFRVNEEIELQAITSMPSLQFNQQFIRWMLSDGAGAFLLENKPQKGKVSFKINWIESMSYANEYPVCMYSGLKVGHDQSISWMDLDRSEVHNDRILNISQDTRLLDQVIVEAMVTKPFPHIQQKHQLKTEDIQWFVPHYSSLYFHKKLKKGFDDLGFSIADSKWYTSLNERGNVGSASIYIYLRDLMENRPLQHGDNILLFVPESGRFTVFYVYLTVVIT